MPDPSVAASSASAAAARSSALIRSHWRLTSDGGPRHGVAEDVRVAADDLRGDGRLDVGQVEDARLGGELGVEHDLEQQVAELAGELGRGARLERVVDLVGLLEQVLAQRLVGLLAVPRAAVGLAQPGGDPGHRPRAGDGQLRRDRGEVERRLERRRRSSVATVVAVGRPEPADRVVGRVEPAEDASGSRPVGPGRPGSGAGSAGGRLRAEASPSGTISSGRDGSIGRADQALGREHLEPVAPDRAPSGAAPRRRARRAPAPPV